tara:strand:+ start:23 stop:463 length:441 start_codon:yes stop_codon:yes gene_type:complete
MDNIITSDFGSILFQIFIIWLISSFFSGKKKGKKKPSAINKIVADTIKKVGKSLEEKIKEAEIIPPDYKIVVDKIFNKKENESREEIIKPIIPPIETQETEKPKEIVLSEIKRADIKAKLGLKSKSTIRNAIILNEVLGKPVSLRR